MKVITILVIFKEISNVNIMKKKKNDFSIAVKNVYQFCFLLVMNRVWFFSVNNFFPYFAFSGRWKSFCFLKFKKKKKLYSTIPKLLKLHLKKMSQSQALLIRTQQIFWPTVKKKSSIKISAAMSGASLVKLFNN